MKAVAWLIVAGLTWAPARAAADSWTSPKLGYTVEIPDGFAVSAGKDDQVTLSGSVGGKTASVTAVPLPAGKDLAALEKDLAGQGRVVGKAMRDGHPALIFELTSGLRGETVLYPSASYVLSVSIVSDGDVFEKTQTVRGFVFKRVVVPGGLDALVRSAATGPHGLAAVMADSLAIVLTDEETGKPARTKRVARAKLNQKLWDDDLSGLFADLIGGAPMKCDDAQRRCVVTSNAGPEIEYRFGATRDGPKLIEIRLPEGE